MSTDDLGIPIHHYVEVDFDGFKNIVDEIGGVEVCVESWRLATPTPACLLQPGCQILDGARRSPTPVSRHYEEWDGRRVGARIHAADLGRIERQQDFIRSAVDARSPRSASTPFGSATRSRPWPTRSAIDPGSTCIEAGRGAAPGRRGRPAHVRAAGRATTRSATQRCSRLGDGAERSSPTSGARARPRRVRDHRRRHAARIDDRRGSVDVTACQGPTPHALQRGHP